MPSMGRREMLPGSADQHRRPAVVPPPLPQDWLMAADWPTDLLDFDACREEHSPGGTLLFRYVLVVKSLTTRDSV